MLLDPEMNNYLSLSSAFNILWKGRFYYRQTDSSRRPDTNSKLKPDVLIIPSPEVVQE